MKTQSFLQFINDLQKFNIFIYKLKFVEEHKLFDAVTSIEEVFKQNEKHN